MKRRDRETLNKRMSKNSTNVRIIKTLLKDEIKK